MDKENKFIQFPFDYVRGQRSSPIRIFSDNACSGIYVLMLRIGTVYHISSGIKQSFSFQNNPKIDRSRSLGLFRKGTTHIIAKFHGTDSIICSHSRERKTLPYGRINTIY